MKISQHTKHPSPFDGSSESGGSHSDDSSSDSESSKVRQLENFVTHKKNNNLPFAESSVPCFGLSGESISEEGKATC